MVKDRIAATNREQTAVNPVIKRQLRVRLKLIRIQMKEIDSTIAGLVDADPGLFRRRDILGSIPGIGTVTAMAILIEMPELGMLDNKQAASLAGLAPMTRQSGSWTGRAHDVHLAARVFQAGGHPAKDPAALEYLSQHNRTRIAGQPICPALDPKRTIETGRDPL